MNILLGSRDVEGLPQRSYESDWDVLVAPHATKDYIQKYGFTVLEPRKERNSTLLEWTSPDGIKSIVEVLEGVSGAKRRIYTNPMGFCVDKTKTPWGEIVWKLTPLSLLTLKQAHIITTINFSKHIKDIGILRKICGITTSLLDNLNETLREVFDLERAEALARHHHEIDYRKTKAEFFNDTVKYWFDHDDLHVIWSKQFSEDPAYFQILAEGQEVEMDEIKWKALTHDERIKVIMEELVVISFERCTLPWYMERLGKIPIEFQCFDWALFRVCTTLTSGFAREYAIENYTELKQKQPQGWMAYFLQQYEDGHLKLLPDAPRMGIQ